MIISKIDGTHCKNALGLSIHLKKHGMTLLDYKVKYENFIIPKCIYCESNAKMINNNSFRKTCGSTECKRKMCKSQVWDDERREKLRQSRFKFLNDKNNRKKTAWHNKSNNKLSFGEKFLHETFIEHKIYEKYDVINEFPIYPYFIDFAFVNEKVAVEFDGKCHFKNGNKRIQHDIDRDEYLQKIGWRVYRIAYFEIDDFKICDLISFLGNPGKKQLKTQLEKYNDIKKNKKKQLVSKRDQKNAQYVEQQLKLAELVVKSNIDFSKYGWVNEVAELINKKPQKISKWMKLFLPKLYETECFKRKTKS